MKTKNYLLVIRYKNNTIYWFLRLLIFCFKMGKVFSNKQILLEIVIYVFSKYKGTKHSI